MIAAFDFDGTLTRGDSLLPFLRQLRGGAGLGVDLLLSAPQLAGFALGLVRNDVAKQALLRRSLGGRLLSELQTEALRFAADTLPTLLRAEMLERLRWHQAQGHACLLISASPALYLAPWAAQQGFTACLATELEVDARQRLTGALRGANCHGEEKLRRLDAWLAEQGRASMLDYAYGDTRGDLPLLRRARHGHWVGGGRAPAAPHSPQALPA